MTDAVREKILAALKAENENTAGTYSGEVIDMLVLYGGNDDDSQPDVMSNYVDITGWDTPDNGEMNISDSNLEFTISHNGSITEFKLLSQYTFAEFGGIPPIDLGISIPIENTSVQLGDKVKLTELTLTIGG